MKPGNYLLFFAIALSFLRLDASEIDSLEQLLPKIWGEEKIEVLTRLSYLHARHEHEQAFEYAYEALDLAKKLKYEKGIANALLQMSTAYYYLSKYKQDVDYLKQSLEIKEKLNDTIMVADATNNIAINSQMIGKFEESLAFSFRALQLRDSLHQAQTKAIIAEFEAKYEFEKKTREIEILRQENRIQELKLKESRFFIYGFAGISFAIIIIALLLIQRGRLYAKQKNAELKQRLFRTQMNPHFIFNALNAIQSYIYKNEPAEAGKYLSNFARLIRLVLYNSREDFITLDSEIKTLEYYLQLQRLRFNNKFDFNIDVDHAIHPDLIMIPPMLAQPFIENSIEHGIQHLSTKGSIHISFKIKNGCIYFSIIDSGVGVSQSSLNNINKQDKHETSALGITQERLRLLNKNKQEKIELLIEELVKDGDEVEGTSITFNIPFMTINNKSID